MGRKRHDDFREEIRRQVGQKHAAPRTEEKSPKKKKEPRRKVRRLWPAEIGTKAEKLSIWQEGPFLGAPGRAGRQGEKGARGKNLNSPGAGDSPEKGNTK